MRRRVLWLTVCSAAAIFVFTATACSGGGKVKTESAKPAGVVTAEEPTTTVAPTTTTTTVEQKVLADAVNFRAVYDRLSEQPNPDDPAIAATQIDPHASRFRKFLAEQKAKNQAFRGSWGEIRRKVLSIQGTTAEVEECIPDNHRELYNTQTGQTIGLVGRSTMVSQIKLQLVDGTWKVVSGSERSATSC